MGWLLGGHPHVHRHVSGFLGPPPPSDRFGDQIQMALSPAGAAIMEDAFETVRRRFTSAADNARETHERIKAAMTAEPFLSSSWYRVARRRPKLRDHASVQRHRYRGRTWYVVQDHATGRVHRLSPAGYIIGAAMDRA